MKDMLKQENEELRENIKQLTEWKRKTVTCQECYDEGLEDGKLKLQQENKELKDKLLLADRIAKDILKVFEIDEYDIYADQNEIIDKIKECKLRLDKTKTIRRNK